MSKPVVELFTNNQELITPKRQTEGAAGYDLYSPITKNIQPNSSAIIDMDFCMGLPENIIIRTYMRSGLASKYGLCLKGKQFFTNMENITVEIQNLSDEPFLIENGSRIAQMVFHVCK